MTTVGRVDYRWEDGEEEKEKEKEEGVVAACIDVVAGLGGCASPRRSLVLVLVLALPLSKK